MRDADRLGDGLLVDIAARSNGATEAAFFDLDKTVIARSSTLAMSRPLMRGGFLRPPAVVKSLYAQTVYRLVGADHDRMERMRQATLEATRGWDADQVRQLVRETIEEVIAPLAYREALELIAEHQQAGRDVWLVSSSGEEIVEPFAEYLGVRDVIATRSGIDADGRYDGTLEFYAYADAKATAIRQVAEVRGYDLGRSFAYSDSITDLPMLAAVGRPVVVNPDRGLRAVAASEGWEAQNFASPVRLRDRLPVAPASTGQVVAGVAGVTLVALLVWRHAARD